MWSRQDIGWIAGILEGEGSFTCCETENRQNPKKTYKYKKIAITCSMTDEDVIRKLGRLIKVPCSVRMQSRKHLNHKDIWVLQIQDKASIYAVCAAVYPLLGMRRKDQCRNLMEACVPVENTSNTSGFKGVTWEKKKQKWRAAFNGKTGFKHIGYFDSPKEASKAYQDFIKENRCQ